MAAKVDKYASYVEHPRFGRGPQITGLNPDAIFGTVLHWHSPKSCRIADTAIPADVVRQTQATVPVTHYFDVKRICRDCERPFIFFAREQKHWYEALGFKLESDCIRCSECRKKQQGLASKRERYEELFHVQDRSIAENLEMAECCLTLIEAEVFSTQQTAHVRRLLNLVPADSNKSRQASRQKMLGRVKAIEIKRSAAD